MIHYPIPPHKQKAFREWKQLSLPITEGIHYMVLSLPISPVMDEKEFHMTVEVINNY
jgi:dTDP-4-amino-4,6-dideoxygalactose transaminase